MKRIEAGMRVRVLDRVPGRPDNFAIKYIGTVQVVEAFAGNSMHGPRWYLAEVYDVGEHGNRLMFPEGDLEPIPDSQELSTWEEVQSLTHWNPTKVTA